MHITILSVGRLKEKYLQEAQKEYLKRLSAYARVNIVEVSDEPVREGLSPGMEDIIRSREGARLAGRLDPGNYIIALDREGRQMASEELSSHISGLALEGRSSITLIIGGTLGLSPEILKAAQLKLSFSKMTFPHQLMRIILLEQIFRAFKIERGEPYHR